MIRSIRGRLLAGVVAGTSIILLSAGIALHQVTQRSMQQAFDQALAARARSLASLVESEDGALEFEGDERTLSEFAAGSRPEYFQIHTADGALVQRSWSLGKANLVAPEPLPGDAFTAAPLTLPDGRAGRVATVRGLARSESRAAPLELTISVARGTEDLARQFAALRRLLILIASLTLAATVATLAFTVWRGLRPLQSLAGQIARLDVEHLASRIHLPDAATELESVVQVCNQLLARLEGAVERERSFTSDVAHELRTPLAGFRSILEVAAQRERSTGEYRSAMKECLGIAGEMQGMITNLLMLARLERGQVAAAREPVHVLDLLGERWAPHAATAAEKRLRLDWSVPDTLCVEADAELLRQVFSNLLANAVTYADPAGSVSISAGQSQDSAAIRVRNSGSRIASEQVPLVFERFWRGDASRQGTGLHVGLGLSLAKRLVHAMRGRIAASSERGGCFEIVVELPLACGSPQTTRATSQTSAISQPV